MGGPAAPRATSRTWRWMSAAGVLAASIIALCANVLVARFYQRWDVTSRGLYSLSAATLETLHALDRRLDVVVFLGRSDPLTLSVRHLLSAYAAETRNLEPRFVDPDRDPAEFLALQRKYDIVAGKTEDGRLVTDAALVVASDERHWFITADELISFDAADGRSRPRLEQALTSAIRNVQERERATVCFSSGHQEFNVDSGGPTGLAELRYRLEKNNYDIRVVELGAVPRLPELADCRVLIVAGPERPFSEAAGRHVAAYLRSGGNALLLVDPILGEDARIEPSGLEVVAEAGGIELGGDFVVERDPDLRLATGRGEAYFAVPREHDVTRGLVQGVQVMLRLVVNVAQSLRSTPHGSPRPLIVTSEQAYAVRDVQAFGERGAPPEPGPRDARGPLTLAMAAELRTPSGASASARPRLVVVGSSNLAWARNWKDPAALGNRLFVENAISWLAARPALISVPEKAAADVGLSLTEESLGEVFRYVMLYLPGSALALGLFVVWRRRAAERRSRKPRRDEPPAREGA